MWLRFERPPACPFGWRPVQNELCEEDSLLGEVLRERPCLEAESNIVDRPMFVEQYQVRCRQISGFRHSAPVTYTHSAVGIQGWTRVMIPSMQESHNIGRNMELNQAKSSPYLRSLRQHENRTFDPPPCHQFPARDLYLARSNPRGALGVA